MAQTNILLESGTNEVELVVFYIDEIPPGDPGSVKREFFGVNVAKVLEILRAPQLTDMPDAIHPAVLGAFDLRSEVVPLIDLGQWLKKNTQHDETPKVVVTHFNLVTTAFLVSGVTRIHRLSWEEIEAPSLQVSSLTDNSVTGVVRLEGKLVFILDMEKIVTDLNPQLRMEWKVSAETRKEIEDRSLKAVIVDDSSMVRNTLATMLEEAGFDVTKKINGQDAWEELARLKETASSQGQPVTDYVDIVISDIEMPTMDGHNLTKRIKSDQTFSKVPVVLFSSIITDTLRHKGEAVGADDQVSKVELQTLVGRALTAIDHYRK